MATCRAICASKMPADDAMERAFPLRLHNFNRDWFQTATTQRNLLLVHRFNWRCLNGCRSLRDLLPVP